MNRHVCMQTTSGKPASTKVLEDYCRDLCQQARDKSIDVVRTSLNLGLCLHTPVLYSALCSLRISTLHAVVHGGPMQPAEHRAGRGQSDMEK